MIYNGIGMSNEVTSRSNRNGLRRSGQGVPGRRADVAGAHMTLQLPGDMSKFIEDRVKAGEYASAQEVICAGLRLLKMQSASDGHDDFQPGEWDRMLEEAEAGDAMSLDQVIAKRRAERARARAGR
jgi:putative addiction module CopG family antidote